MFRLLFAVTLLCTTLAFTGCEQKEKVIDIETPGGDIEVMKSEDSGSVEIDVDDK